MGIESLQMGVFGGIIVGLGVAALHNRYHNIKLPEVLSFFGGERFVPIISAVTYLIAGAVVWWCLRRARLPLLARRRGPGHAGGDAARA